MSYAREQVSGLPREHGRLGRLAQHQHRKAQFIRQVGVVREASLHNLIDSLNLQRAEGLERMGRGDLDVI